MTNAYDLITDQIVADIESGKADSSEWVMPWHGNGGMPFSLSTGKAYRGVNVIALWASAHRAGHTSPVWGTFKQWKAQGGMVRKGQKGTKVVFWKQIEISDTADDTGEASKFIPICKAYTVFNADQVDGAEDIVPGNDADSSEGADVIADVEAMITATGADIRYNGEGTLHNRACYVPSTDTIYMPARESFTATEHSSATDNFYSTLFHELAHWTGAEHRLDRKRGSKFGDTDYAFEELVAELSAAFTCAATGITSSPRPDHGQYIASWLKALKSEKRFIFEAAKHAGKATDWITGETVDTAKQSATA